MNLVLNLTEHCNLRCLYCYYRAEPQHQNMSIATLEQAIDFALDRSKELSHNWCNLTFFGGEPLLEKDLLRHGVTYARTKNSGKIQLRFAVNTNGTLLDAETLDFMELHQFRIYLSLDGPQEVHDAQRPCKDTTSSWERIAPWFDRLQKLDVVVLRVIHHTQITSIASSVAWILERGFRSMTTAVNFDGNWTAEDFDQLHLQYETIAELWMQEKRTGRPWYFGTFTDKIRLQLEGLSCKNTTCNIGLGGLAVSVRGNLYPCTRFVNDHGKMTWRIGTLDTGVDPARMAEIERYLQQDKESCKECSIKDRCHGNGCACIAYSTTGGIWDISPEVCTHERMVAQIADRLAFSLLE